MKKKLTATEIVNKKREEKQFRDVVNSMGRWILVLTFVVISAIVFKYQQDRYTIAAGQIPDKYIVVSEYAVIYDNEYAYLHGEPEKASIEAGRYLYSIGKKGDYGLTFIATGETDFIPWEYVEEYK